MDPRAQAAARVAQVITTRATRQAATTLTKGWQEQGTREPQSQWDVKVAAAWATVIAAALLRAFTPSAILAAIFTARQHKPPPLPPGLAGIPDAAPIGGPLPEPARDVIVQSVIGSLAASTPDTAPLRGALEGATADGYLAGVHAATEQLADVGATPTGPLADLDTGFDWHEWTPGTPDAGEYLRRGGYGRILDATGITVKGVTDATMRRIGELVADGLDRGDSIDSIARAVRGYVDDPKRALRIAHDATTRALTRAALDGYTEAGISGFDWIASAGACTVCREREASNPHPLNEPGPPAHPHCRCAAAPAVD